MTGTVTFQSEGFLLVPGFIDDQWLARLESALPGARIAQRNMLSLPVVQQFAVSPLVCKLMASVLGLSCFAVRAILFDKTPTANWNLGWHQDCVIPVRERKDTAGFRGWSAKEGVLHVQAPVDIMSRMAALRVHLDDCAESNGALRVLPRSHQNGILSDDEIANLDKSKQVVCALPKGGALVMHSLLVHASARSATPRHRRVLHIDFAATELPGGLEWHSRIGPQPFGNP